MGTSLVHTAIARTRSHGLKENATSLAFATVTKFQSSPLPKLLILIRPDYICGRLLPGFFPNFGSPV
jgi:hypothetical protein